MGAFGRHVMYDVTSVPEGKGKRNVNNVLASAVYDLFIGIYTGKVSMTAYTYVT